MSDEKKKPVGPEVSRLFRFKGTQKPLKENSLQEGQVLDTLKTDV